ncbi:unnamed protein product [Nezara viridula]|uniref:Uncharacterized protein n=1 Tax=Nezara viridula TaxID=85310 RepID=A0A9P0ML50_NEZVI|nr:unnamed protein product [Nezara viridula]
MLNKLKMWWWSSQDKISVGSRHSLPPKNKSLEGYLENIDVDGWNLEETHKRGLWFTQMSFRWTGYETRMNDKKTRKTEP